MQMSSRGTLGKRSGRGTEGGAEGSPAVAGPVEHAGSGEHGRRPNDPGERGDALSVRPP